MTGLRTYERDLELPEQFGDRVLVRSAEDLLALVNEHLMPSGSQAVGARCLQARWKPKVAVATCWEIELLDGSTRWVTQKSYTGRKVQHLARHFRSDEHAVQAAAPLAPFTVLEEEGAFLATFPVDRVLRGVGRLINLRRTARHLDGAELWPGWKMRLRASRLEPLRYKIERRAVFRLEAKLRDETGGRQAMILGARVLPPEQATEIAKARGQVGSITAPRLMATDLDAGILFEEWLEGRIAEAGPERERAAGQLLAELHRHQVSPVTVPTRPPTLTRSSYGAFADHVPTLDPIHPGRGSVWIHGDVHPDQVFETGDGHALLDLDTLRPGRVEEDLSSWLARRLAEEPDQSWSEVSEGLLAGYEEHGGRCSVEEVRLRTAHALVDHAEAALRRMERSAIERARGLLDRGAALATGGSA